MMNVASPKAPSRRAIVKVAGALVAGIAAPAFLRVRSAHAVYPDRPVKFVVANTPGGPSDIVARIVTAALEQSTGKVMMISHPANRAHSARIAVTGMMITRPRLPDVHTWHKTDIATRSTNVRFWR